MMCLGLRRSISSINYITGLKLENMVNMLENDST